MSASKLRAAAAQGDGRAVTVQLAQGANAMLPDEDGQASMWYAVNHDHHREAKILFKLCGKALLEQKDTAYGDTPLHRAAYKDCPKMVEQLVSYGANSEAKQKHGRTPLFVAAEWGREGAANVLLGHDAELEQKDDEHGDTPLHISASKGRLRIVENLTYWGANLEARQQQGKSPLFLTAEWGNEAVLQVLIDRGAEFESKDYLYGDTPLLRAASQGHLKIIEKLLNSGANLDARQYQGTTAIYLATAWGKEAVAKILRERGADPNQRLKDSDVRPISNPSSLPFTLTIYFT